MKVKRINTSLPKADFFVFGTLLLSPKQTLALLICFPKCIQADPNINQFCNYYNLYCTEGGRETLISLT